MGGGTGRQGDDRRLWSIPDTKEKGPLEPVWQQLGSQPRGERGGRLEQAQVTPVPPRPARAVLVWHRTGCADRYLTALEAGHVRAGVAGARTGGSHCQPGGLSW